MERNKLKRKSGLFVSITKLNERGALWYKTNLKTFKITKKWRLIGGATITYYTVSELNIGSKLRVSSFTIIEVDIIE